MTKEFALEQIKLLSAIESWSFSKGTELFPDYLYDKITASIEVLTKEVLK